MRVPMLPLRLLLQLMLLALHLRQHKPGGGRRY